MRKLLSLLMVAVMLFAMASNLFACSFEMRDPMNPTAEPDRAEKVTSGNHYVENVRPDPKPQDTEKKPDRSENAEPKPPEEPVPMYTVSFVLEGSDWQPDPQVLMEGEIVWMPDVVTDEYSRFDGIWYLDPSYGKEYDFGMPIYEDLTLYARVEKYYTVTFVVEGNSHQPEPQTVKEYEYIQTPEFVLDEYCSFDGNWYLDPYYKEMFYADMPVKENMTLYARVTRDPAAPAMILKADLIFDRLVTTSTNDVMYSDLINEGSREFVRLSSESGDPYFLAMLGANAVLPNYMVISYRTNSPLEGEFFIGSGAGPNGAGDHLKVDWQEGDWNLLIVDLSKAEGLTAIENGLINYLRVDFFAGYNSPDDYIDLEYIAFFDSPKKARNFDAELHKAPMWDEARDVVTHQSFDELDMYVNGENTADVFMPGSSHDWNHIVDCDSSVDALRYWGWLGVKDKIGRLGYQIDDGERIYDDAFTAKAEPPIIDAALSGGADSATRMEILIPLKGLIGTHTVRTLYMDPYGNEVCLSEFVVNISYVFEPETGVEDSRTLLYTDNGDGTCSVAGIGGYTDSKLVIPSEYNGMPVVGIADNAFWNCDSITTVSIPDSVTSIGDLAFADCSNLTSIRLSTALKEIPLAAFCGCTSLKSIRIPEGITYIGVHAFAQCTSLTSLTLPMSLSKIDSYLFSDCYSLTTIKYSGSEENWNALIEGVDLGVNGSSYTVYFG